MINTKYRIPLSFLNLVAIVALVFACQPDAIAQSPNRPTDNPPHKKPHSGHRKPHSARQKPQTVDPSLFVKDGLVEDITEEPCTLSGGTETTCYRITTVTSEPSDHQAGPWCPSNITATAEEGGIWIEEGKVV